MPSKHFWETTSHRCKRHTGTGNGESEVVPGIVRNDDVSSIATIEPTVGSAVAGIELEALFAACVLAEEAEAADSFILGIRVLIRR